MGPDLSQCDSGSAERQSQPNAASLSFTRPNRESPLVLEYERTGSVSHRVSHRIPLFDEIDDQPVHQIVVDSALAFLYPFEPMHVQIAIDEEVVFRQGKFARRAGI